MMRSFIERAAILLALTLSSYLSLVFTVHAEPHQYVLDPNKSKLYVQVFKDDSTLAAALAHDHVVLATGWKGKVVVDTEKLAACAVEVTVPVSGLRADLPKMRTLVGYNRLKGVGADVLAGMGEVVYPAAIPALIELLG